MVDMKSLSDSELAEIIERDELVKAARAEVERRRTNEITTDATTPGVKASSHAACPGCGQHDTAIKSVTLYGTPELARGGEPTGTGAFCGQCRAWYNAGDGTWIDFSKVFTY